MYWHIGYSAVWRIVLLLPYSCLEKLHKTLYLMLLIYAPRIHLHVRLHSLDNKNGGTRIYRKNYRWAQRQKVGGKGEDNHATN